MNNIILWIGILSIIVFLIMYIRGEAQTRKNVEVIQNGLAKSMMNTVSAGSHYREIPREMQSISTQYNLFRRNSGKALDTENYNSYIVQGDSMQFCDIRTGDIVFSKKNFCLSDLTEFPSVVILKNQKASQEQCQFKIRRAWYICADNLSDSDYEKILREIMLSSDYLILKSKASNIYESDEKMLENFMTKLREYRDNIPSGSLGQEIVISSTYNVDNKKIQFSIHRTSSIIGLVKFVVSMA